MLLETDENYNIPKVIKELILKSEINDWKSVDITYEEPHVERLWLQYDTHHRVFLHKIYPCEQSFRHPHEWECAVWILKGSYYMDLGNEKYNYTNNVYSAGSFYEMLDSHLYHSVFPLNNEPVYSLIINGPLFEYPIRYPKPPKQFELIDSKKIELLEEFKELLN